MPHSLQIDWTAPATPVDGYNVYRGPASDNATRQQINLTLVLVNTFLDENVFTGETYFYEVTSVKNGQESVDSLEVSFGPIPYPPSPSNIALGDANRFGVLAATTVTNTGPSTIRGDVGLYAGTSVTGFAPARITGEFHITDAVAQAGQTALTSAYNGAVASLNPGPAPATTVSGDIGGSTRTPGVYHSTSSLGITGSLVLDGEGNPNAVFIFQMGSTLTTAVGSSIVLVNGAQAANVLWQVGSSATIGVGSHFAGTILAQTSITVNTGAVVEGRLLARTGAVTLDTVNLYLNLVGRLISPWTPNTQYEVGDVLFDCASGSFQYVTTAGTSGSTRPNFALIPDFTVDGSARWIQPSVPLYVSTPILPPLQSVPPAPPSPPTGVEVTDIVSP